MLVYLNVFSSFMSLLNKHDDVGFMSYFYGQEDNVMIDCSSSSNMCATIAFRNRPVLQIVLTISSVEPYIICKHNICRSSSDIPALDDILFIFSTCKIFAAGEQPGKLPVFMNAG